jgi:hypothetical protein
MEEFSEKHLKYEKKEKSKDKKINKKREYE